MAKFKNENGEELNLDQILGEDGDYQAEFDKKIQKALEKQKTDIDAEVQKKLDAAIAGREEEIRKAETERSEERRLQVGSGDRSERIRTYNFPQNRLTDHRINLTVYSLDKVMEGELEEILDALEAYAKAERLKSAGL